MQQNIPGVVTERIARGFSRIGNDKPVALTEVEPFYDTRDLQNGFACKDRFLIKLIHPKAHHTQGQNISQI